MSKEVEKGIVDEIRERDARDAAWVTLKEKLDSKKRGDRITAAEIVEWTGFDDWRSFGQRIRTWAKAKPSERGALVPVVNDGWKLTTPQEDTDYAEQRRRSAFKKEKDAVRVLASTPVHLLDERGQRRHGFQLTRTVQRAELHRTHDKEIKSELKLTAPRERVPLRALPSAGKK